MPWFIYKALAILSVPNKDELLISPLAFCFELAGQSYDFDVSCFYRFVVTYALSEVLYVFTVATIWI
ncbi:MAG: hypothetical protein SOI28_05585 [Rahnella inusitata]|jgi:hypothetical protein